jgi:hypothetical protein
VTGRLALDLRFVAAPLPAANVVRLVDEHQDPRRALPRGDGGVRDC